MVTCLNLADDGAVGQLGNKLFIIAALIALAKENNDEVVLPDNWQYKNLFKNNLRTLPVEDLQKKITNYYKEPYFHYCPIPYIKDLHLTGYFQSEKYFEKYKQDIIKYYFVPNDTLLDNIFINFHNNIYPKINECDGIVSIHVRRGDYLNLSNYHPFCGEQYYKNAINYFEKMYNHTFYYMVFSDDIAWCKKFFQGPRFIFSENNSNTFDLFSMAHICDHNIIANSTFSWWGAYLNNNPDKIVLYPNRWFGPAYNHNINDLIPQGWIKCPVLA